MKLLIINGKVIDLSDVKIDYNELNKRMKAIDKRFDEMFTVDINKFKNWRCTI